MQNEFTTLHRQVSGFVRVTVVINSISELVILNYWDRTLPVRHCMSQDGLRLCLYFSVALLALNSLFSSGTTLKKVTVAEESKVTHSFQ